MKNLLLLVMMMLPMVASAHDIQVKNADDVTIYYNYVNDGTELAVTFRGTSYDSYSDEYYGNVVIPEEVTYMNETRRVTSIGVLAFRDCSRLTSVIIPNSVTSIGGDAFFWCSGLTSVTIGNSVTSIGGFAFYNCSNLKKVIVSDIAAWCGISFGGYESNPLIYAHHLYSDENTKITDLIIPNSVTSIGGYAFEYCSGLTSVTIPNSVTSIGSSAFYYCSGLTSVTIPNSVTSIGGYAFYECSGLTSVTIPNSVTSIGRYTFSFCSGLTSVTIPNSVTSIGDGAFSSCSGLTSVTIGNSVTSIGIEAFYYCIRLTSVTIPNSVTSIGIEAFYGCSGLTSVTIPNSVTSIGYQAFNGADIPTVISLIENPFKIFGKSSISRTFSQNTFNNATLYVPKGTIDKYKATVGWKDFLFIEEGTGGGETPTPQQCEKPTISYQNGKLMFACATEGAICQYSITDTDIKAGSGNEVQLTATYNISVYATKTGYDNSETATATLCWIDQQPETEGISNGMANIPANAVLIQGEGGTVKVHGCNDGEQVSVYSINGTKAGSAVSENGSASINTILQPGNVAIVKIGEKSVKIIMK